jgi:mono/diheme cytochrome c family protein
MKRTQSAFLLAGLMAFSGLLLSSFGQQSSTKEPVQKAASLALSEAKAPDTPASALQGPSWLKHLGLSVSQTQMGKMGGNSAPPAAAETPGHATLKSSVNRFLTTFRSNPEQASQTLNDKFMATGADLYRWNCQGCHGPEGKGAPPEINSIIGPVQGTSAALAKKRMEARGIDADDEMISQMTELAATSLRDRLQHGGKNMPAFAYLRSDEVDALLGYLEKLAGVPPTKRDGLLVPESVSSAGEHIARGTCHICHDATGQEAGRMMMMHRGIPSLASIPRERSLSGVVHQVEFGSSGMIKMMGDEVMPAYPYLSEEEIAAVYFDAYSVRQ